MNCGFLTRTVSRYRVVLAFALIIWMTQSPSITRAETPKPKRVLTLYWYGKDFPANIRFERGLQTAFATTGVENYAEYFEPNRFPGKDQAEALREYLQRKYSDRKIDVIIAMSTVSADFLLAHRDELFPGVPIIFHTNTRREVNERAAGTSTGVIPDDVHGRTLETALSLHPNIERVFVINGTIERDKMVEAILRERFKRFESKVAITYLTDFPLDDLLARVKGIPDRSLIFFSRQDYEDPGRSLSMFDVLVLVANSAKVPIYSSGNFVGYGTIGGYAIDQYECGIRAANIALQITNGVPPQTIPIVEVASLPIFDWRQLRRWGIRLSELPQGSETRFRELTLFEQYRWQIVGALTLCALQSFLIACLLAERRRRRRSQAALRERQERYKLATGSGRIVVWDLDLETCAFDADPSFNSLLGYEDQEPGNHLSHWVQLFHQDDVEVVLERARSYLVGEAPNFEAEHRLLQKDGGVRWFLASGTAVRNEQGIAIRMVGTDTDITERKLAEQESQQLNARLLDLQDKERQRIAKELHDGTAQNVFAITINLETLKQSQKALPAKFRNTLTECQTLCQQTVQDIRTLSNVLHPPILDDFGLFPALRCYVDGFVKRSGIDVQLLASQDIGRLPAQIETDLFRIVQESLTNVDHYSESRTAQVQMERQSGQLILRIQHQGRVTLVKPPQTEKWDPRTLGIGLLEIRQRLRHFGGRLEIAADNNGTTITAVVPLEATV
jgi:PAS domain S-box-containing protein